MKKILLFPYHPDMRLIVEYMTELKDISIVGFASYQEDNIIINELNQKIGNTESFEKMLLKCDKIIFLDDYRGCKKEKYYDVLEKAIAFGKEAVFVPQLKKKLELKPYEGNYSFMANEPDVRNMNQYLNEKTKYPVDIPVIAVVGMGKNCNKFENQILMKKMLDEKGYCSAWFSSNPLGSLFGGYTMPGFLFDDTLSFEEKIFRLNHLFFRISRSGTADICLIGIPEGISEYEKYEYNHFAEYPLVIGNAISVDSTVFCTYFLEAPILKEIGNLAGYICEKFDFPVDMISIGTSGYQLLENELDVFYLFLNDRFIKEHFIELDKLPDYIAGVWEKEKLTIGMERILKRLGTNVDAV